MEKVIAIVGPTAVGKTKLSIEIAKMLNAEIISGDAMQIYRGLDIGTAKVTSKEMEGVVHHLLDEKNPDDSYSVAEFQQTVRSKITEIIDHGKVPIIVGGTGLYVKAVLYDYEFSDETPPNDFEYTDLTNEEVHGLLQNVDPESASQLHPNNRRRVVRALNIYRLSEISKTSMLEKQEKRLIYDALIIGLTDEREILYDRINKRVDKMMSDGLLQEVDRLYTNNIHKTTQSMQAIGYKELYEYREGNVDLETAIELIKRNSRRLAKRQFTWFRNQMPTVWFDIDIENFGQTVSDVMNYINNN